MNTPYDLSRIPTEALAGELLKRPDLINPDGLLNPPVFALMDALGVRVCVDGAPLRKNSTGVAELMAIRRGSGPFAGKLCLIGGGVERIRVDGVWQPESVQEALNRHFKNDLGTNAHIIDPNLPQYVQQDMRPIGEAVREGFAPNPNSRHLIALRYLVTLPENFVPKYGSTNLGGQEATAIEWFTMNTMPSSEEFGYQHDITYDAFFRQASILLNE
jgi:ADP-ribose pyrophosphatase YjhB (NUDIX family)